MPISEAMETELMKRSMLSLIYLINGMRHAGIDVDARLARIGIRASALNPHAVFHPSLELSILDYLGQQVAPELGLRVGQHYALAGYGPLLMLLLSAERIEDVLIYGVRFQKLTHLFGTLAVQRQADQIELSYLPIDLATELGQFRAQCETSGTLKFIQDLYKMMGLSAPKIRVVLPFAAPKDQQLLGQYLDYYGQDVQFSADKAYFYLDQQLLGIKIPSADAMTCRLYREKCQKELARLAYSSNSNSLVEQVRDYLELQQGILPSMDKTAQALNMPERTLRHRLQQLNTSFKQIREQLIQRKAIEMIENKSYPMNEIAERLGYSETAAFNHAFKRWFGHSPRQYRK